MNPLGEQYVRADQRFGDAQTVYEVAERDRLLSPSELGWVAARLRRLDPTREANHWRDDHGRLHSWPKFQLTERQRDRLGRRLLEGGMEDAKTVATYLGASRRWVAGRLDYWRAVSEWKRHVRVVPGYGIGLPVDLLDAAHVDSSLSGVLAAILGHGSDSPTGTRDRLSTSGVGGDIVTAGLRFGRLKSCVWNGTDRTARSPSVTATAATKRPQSHRTCYAARNGHVAVCVANGWRR